MQLYIFHFKGSLYSEEEVEAAKVKQERSLCYLHQQAIPLQTEKSSGNMMLYDVFPEINGGDNSPSDNKQTSRAKTS